MTSHSINQYVIVLPSYGSVPPESGVLTAIHVLWVLSFGPCRGSSHEKARFIDGLSTKVSVAQELAREDVIL